MLVIRQAARGDALVTQRRDDRPYGSARAEGSNTRRNAVPKDLTDIGPFTRIALTLLVAVAVYLLLDLVRDQTFDWHLRLLVAWCSGASFALAQVATMFARLDADGVRRRCQSQTTEGHAAILLGGILVAVASIGGVIYLLTDVHASDPHYRLHLIFSLATIFVSWVILQTMFAVYYAWLYYAAAGNESIAGGIRFTSPDPPDYWEFLYFSCTLAMSYAVSDIAVTSKFIHRIILIQTLVAFLYYTVIIGLVMNAIGTLF